MSDELKFITQENIFEEIHKYIKEHQVKIEGFDDIKECIDNLWFDIGHLWCSSILHEFDFYKAADELISDMNIIGVHLNHNLTPQNAPKDQIYDSHTHLYAETEQNLKPVIKNLLKKGVEIFTLEIRDGDIEDVKILIDWLQN